MSGATYTPYSSQTLAAAAPGQPTGASKLCLSCHDGTVALGSVKSLPFSGEQSGVITGLAAAILGTATSVLGTDLRNDHPISFNYDAALLAKNTEIVNPAALSGKFRPGDGQLQCSNCHDPHSDANPKFMLTGYQDGAGEGSPLCRTCHAKQYWASVPNNAHRTSTAQWNGAGINPWHIDGQNLPNNANSTPKANGCESCHQPHNGASTEHLLKKPGANQSSVCLTCHNGSVAASAKRIDTVLSKAYSHPGTGGLHNPKRQTDGLVREDQADLNSRHAECADCHNPHAVSAGVSPSMPSATNNLTSNVLKGVWGVTPSWPGNWGDVTTYTTVQDTTYQYQICLKCHSYYAFGLTPPADPYGMVAGGFNTDQAREFNPNNASYHPVVAAGKNPFFTIWNGSYASSLINGMTPTSVLNCTECHSGNDPSLPKGPHGADAWPIIGTPYGSTIGTIGTSNQLCFKCHDYNIYSGTDDGTANFTKTGFRGGAAMNLHVRHQWRLSLAGCNATPGVCTATYKAGNPNGIPCYACHTAVPHGSPNKALLVYGRGASKAPAPYNSHAKFQVCNNNSYADCTDYGINSNITNIDSIASGTWTKATCHTGSGVGSCYPTSSYP